MKKKLVGRVLGITLAAIMGVSTPISAFAQEEAGGLPVAVGEVEEVEDSSVVVNSASAEEAEEAENTACAKDAKAVETAGEEKTGEEAQADDEEKTVEVIETEEPKEAASDEEKQSEDEASEDGAAEAIIASEDNETEDIAAEETGEAEELPEKAPVETEDSALLGSSRRNKSEVNLTVEFIGFGDEADAFIAEQGEDVYEIDAARYSDEVYYLDVLLKMWPFVTNSVLDYVTVGDSEEHLHASYYGSYGGISNCLGVDMGMVPVEFLDSGATIRIYAHWTKNVLEGYTLYANGGVFDDTVLFGGSSITYTVGDDKSIKPVEGNDNNVEVEVTYNSDKTVAFVPVMQNGFLPLPQDNAGVSMDLAGRPYDGDRLPLLGWNTRSDGSGELYTGERILLEKEFRHSKESRLDPPITLSAIFPEYYGAEFILDGESYVGDYWTETPNAAHTESLENLFTLAKKGAEEKFVKEGHTLSWFLNEDCTIPADFTTLLDDCKRIEDRLKVYGQWTEVVPEVKTAYGTVHFNNVEGADEGVQLEVGKTLDLSEHLFTKKGYTFKNWTATVNGKSRTFAKNARITKCFKNDGEELTLTANWTIDTYKLTYVLGGAAQAKTAPKSYNVENEVQLPVPAKKGYVFKGWDVKADGKAVTDPAEQAKVYDAANNRIPAGACGNLTFSARFVPFGYKILFHVEGTEEPLILQGYGYDELLKYTDTINFNNAALQIEDELDWHETRPGQNNPCRDLKITGFSRTEGGKPDFDRKKNYTKLTGTEEELHLYAITEEKTYEINYHLDEYEGATLTKPVYTFKSGNKKFALPKATCPGYKFYGWEFDFSRNSDKSLFYNYVRMCTPYECDAKFALTVAENVNNDIEVRPYFVPNKIKVYVSPNGSDVYEDVNVETYEGTDWRCRKVSGKRAFGVVYYGSDSLYSDWYNESMDSWYRPGYEFVGYSKNPKATSEDEIFDKLYYGIEDFSDVATSGSGTIYCIWKKAECEVNTYPATLLDGKEVVDEAFVYYDFPDFDTSFVHGSGKTIKLPKAELPGYEFLGWKLYNMDKPDRFTKVTMKGGYVTAVSSASCYSVDIYPVFKRCVYDLAIDCNGGSYGKLKKFYVARDLDFDEEVSRYLLPYNSVNVQRKGYRLMGFARDKKGETGMVLNADGMPLYKAHSLVLNGNGKVTLYAIWKKVNN